ncbi:MAG: N-acetyl-gamma-glutamyl-phosphate reductase [Candidatus Aureabacteria bacterium]|nr:N-acetyl-gamma-glutamyl-phosphate reductase [Candidatus Auribacterota bacterium]
MLRVAIVGATGYTGCELLDILIGHPEVKITSLTAKLDAPIKIHDEFPRFKGRIDLPCTPLDAGEVARSSDLIFLSLPHGVSMKYAALFLKAGKKVIDLSADFRFADVGVFQQWYGIRHEQTGLLKEAVYGLPELHAERIRTARLIANPGCYPTGSILALAPLVKERVVELDGLVIDSKSGVTGAGRKASLPLSFGECNESFRAYKVGAHQHTPEIESELGILAGHALAIQFTPHLVPMNRGILTTAYARPLKETSTEEIINLYGRFYAKAPFVRVAAKGRLADTKDVWGLNYCDISIVVDNRTHRIVVISAIDNLVKGAAGQAVQNMNLMSGFPETMGLA